MAHENPTWGQARVAAELSVKLGIYVSPRTVRAYWPPEPERRGHRRTSSQNWSRLYWETPVPFVCSETIELAEELVGSYLHKVHLHNRLESDKNAASRRILCIKVERIVCLLDRSDFEPGQNFCAAHPGEWMWCQGTTQCHIDTSKQNNNSPATGFPSPDGRHLAILGTSSEANVWTIDNF